MARWYTEDWRAKPGREAAALAMPLATTGRQRGRPSTAFGFRRTAAGSEHMAHIRRYDSADAEAVSQLIRTTMRISNSADYPLERLQPLLDYFSAAQVDQLSHDRECLVAEEEDQVVGTAGLAGDELVTFFVSPEQQGRGIGAALLEALEAIARGRGYRELKVEASLTGVAFYERHGYQRTGAILDGTAGPQISMRKQLQGEVAARRA